MEGEEEDGEFRGSSVRAMDDFTRTCSGYYLGRENEKKIESRDFLPSFLFFFSKLIYIIPQIRGIGKKVKKKKWGKVPLWDFLNLGFTRGVS